VAKQKTNTLEQLQQIVQEIAQESTILYDELGVIRDKLNALNNRKINDTITYIDGLIKTLRELKSRLSNELKRGSKAIKNIEVLVVDEEEEM
jgi:hypothetical protein